MPSLVAHFLLAFSILSLVVVTTADAVVTAILVTLTYTLRRLTVVVLPRLDLNFQGLSYQYRNFRSLSF